MRNFKYNLCYSIIYILFFIFIAFSIKDLYLTQDEAFTFGMIHKSFGGIIHYTAMDVHPFLYYFIAKICIIPFRNVYTEISVLRIVSAIPYLILLIVGNTTIKHRFGKETSLLFMFSIVMMPLLNRFIFVERMYSLSVLSTTLVFFGFVYIYKGFLSNTLKSFIPISFLTLMACYSHYYAIISISIIYILFVIVFSYHHKIIRNIVYSMAINIVFYVPWLKIFIKQINNTKKSFWSGPVTLKNILTNFYQSFAPETDDNPSLIFKILGFVFVMLLFVIFIIAFLKYHGYKDVIVDIGLGVFIGTFIGAIILSIVMHHSAMVNRYFTQALGPWYFSISLFISKYCKHTFKCVLVSLFIIMGLASYSVKII